MCGIAGYIGTNRIEDGRIESCLATMRHRGPDGSGVYRDERRGNHCLLLHTRLSILDLDQRAAQPMRFGQSVLSYNGELYNYLEIKKRLEVQGENFFTTSDTEVLLRQLGLFGPEGLDACEGMWAFALYDEKDGSLLLCRDRFGEKPLYLFRDDHGLFFGSEVKFLAALTGRKFAPDLDQIRRYLVNGYKALYKQPGTFFAGIDELQAATCLRITADGKERSERYWTASAAPEEAMTYEEAVQGARQRLLRSVELRLRADVPLAFCMSGGVDSNALIAIARKVFNYDVHGFTIVNTDARYDEWDLVQEAVRDLDIRHTAVPVKTEGFLDGMRNLVRMHDAPVYTITYYAHSLLMKSISEQGYKVSVSGTAADELFTGYYDHHSMYLASMHETMHFDEALSNWEKHIKPIVRNPLLQDPYAFVVSPEQREHIYLDATRYKSYLTTLFDEAFTEAAYHKELLRNRMLNELFHEATPVILHEDDLNAMSYSIENRSPFLDRDLFTFCNTIPTRHLIQDGYNKKVLRDAMEGIVPSSILNERRKVGFNAPIFDFLAHREEKVRDMLLADSPIFDIIRRDVIEHFLNKDTMPNSDSKFLFYFLSAKFFLEECI